VTTTGLLAPETLPPVAEPAPGVLEHLVTLRASAPVVVSLYVRLDVQARIRNRYRIAVRDAIRRARHAADSSPLSRQEREALHRDLERLEEYLDHAGALPHSPGVALYACESLGLFQVLPLPRVLHTRLLLGERPRLAEAVAAVEGFGRILVALVDRTHARFFELTAFEVRELSGLQLPATRGGKYHSDRADAPGWGEHDFHNRIREERHRHAAAVSRQLAALVAEGPCQGIVLAGPTRTIMEQQRFLPRNLARLVLGTARLNPTAATAAQVGEAALAARAAWEQARENSILAEVEEAVSTGWAVNGARETLRALGRGQVRVLVVPAGQTGSGYRCPLSRRLVLAPGDCRGEGEPIPVPDLVTEALEEAFRQQVEVEVIDDPEIRTRVDGLGALLRFR
jgi:peptide chain release factor subunit 1